MNNNLKDLINSTNNDSFKMGVITAFLTIDYCINSLIKKNKDIDKEIGIKAIQELINKELDKEEYKELLIEFNNNI